MYEAGDLHQQQGVFIWMCNKQETGSCGGAEKEFITGWQEAVIRNWTEVSSLSYQVTQAVLSGLS